MARTATVVQLSVKCKNVELAARVLDYAYSKEGHLLYNFGVEGVSYTMKNGKPIYTPLIINNPQGLAMTQAMSHYMRSHCNGPFVQDKGYIEQYYNLPEQQEAAKVWPDNDWGKYMLPPITPTPEFTLGSFYKVFQNPNIISGYKNTLFVVVVGVAVNIFMTALGAYFLSRKKALWVRPITILIIITMFIDGGLIPFFFTVKSLHLDNTLWALIIPTAINTYNMIIMRTAFSAIPDEMEESAIIDGAGHFTILFRIMIPLAMPTIAVMILYYGVHHWNAWFHAMIFLRSREMFPLQLILREILIQNDTTYMTVNSATGEEAMISETVKYAVIVVATLPILALYPFLQRYFVKGVMIGSLKG